VDRREVGAGAEGELTAACPQRLLQTAYVALPNLMVGSYAEAGSCVGRLTLTAEC